MSERKLTPMLQQYFDAKKDHPDALMFFRMGDFYELFFEDAETVAREIDLTLTARDKDKPNPIPMAGVPHHAARGYIKRLIDKGYRVAICEQLEDPSKTKSIVRRGVTRVITPGTVLEEDSLDAKTNNYVVAIAASDAKDGDTIAIAAVDVTTGDLRLCEVLSDDQLRVELQRMQPVELIICEDQAEVMRRVVDGIGLQPTLRPKRSRSAKASIETATQNPLATNERGQQAIVHSSEVLKAYAKQIANHTLRDTDAVVGAYAMVVHYLARTQGGVPAQISEPVVYRSQDYLTLDPASAANLEVFETLMGGRKKGSLLQIIDETVTPAGGRRLRTWLSYPLTRTNAIQRRQDAVTCLVGRLDVRTRIRDLLRETSDIQRSSSKLVAGQGSARDLVALRTTLQRIPGLLEALTKLSNTAIDELRLAMDPCDDLAVLIQLGIVDDPPVNLSDGGVIREGFNDELDEIVSITKDAKAWLLRYEAEQRHSTGISSLKVKHNRVFGYYIEVTRANLEYVPDNYIRKQTLANGERYFTPELKEYEDKILHADERRYVLETRLFEEVRAQVISEVARIRRTAALLARLDALASLAELAHRRDYVAPIVTEQRGIDIADGRHPVVETMTGGERFVPNSISLSQDRRVILITGPNMAGKSTVIRQVALITLLAQIGSHVPARSATIGVVDQIFSRVGASDNLAKGQSTFMVEMSETAHILRNATDRSLIILDEIGRGTSTYYGLSIAWAVTEFLHDDLGASTLFATHYHELTDLSRVLPAVHNMNIAAKEWNDQVIFLRTLVDGPANQSYGIQVARLAGVPLTVVERAKVVLSNLEAADLAEGDTPALALDEAGRLNPRRRPTDQLNLFANAPPAPATSAQPRDPVLDELAKLQLDTLSPIEALNQLYALQKRINRRSR